MSITVQQVPASTDYYDPMTGTVKQDPGRWQIVDDQTSKILAFDGTGADWRTLPNTGGYHRVGWSQGAATLMMLGMDSYIRG